MNFMLENFLQGSKIESNNKNKNKIERNKKRKIDDDGEEPNTKIFTDYGVDSDDLVNEENLPVITKKPCMLPFYEEEEERILEEESFDCLDKKRCELCKFTNSGKPTQMIEKLKEIYSIYENQSMDVTEDKIFEIMADVYNKTIWAADQRLKKGGQFGFKKWTKSSVRFHMNEHCNNFQYKILKRLKFLNKSMEYLERNGFWEITCSDGLEKKDEPLTINQKNQMIWSKMAKQSNELIKILMDNKKQSTTKGSVTVMKTSFQ